LTKAKFQFISFDYGIYYTCSKVRLTENEFLPTLTLNPLYTRVELIDASVKERQEKKQTLHSVRAKSGLYSNSNQKNNKVFGLTK